MLGTGGQSAGREHSEISRRSFPARHLARSLKRCATSFPNAPPSVEMTNRTKMSFRTEWNECEKSHFLVRQLELSLSSVAQDRLSEASRTLTF